jgi:serine/threonine-protein kinase RsbW
MPTKKPKAKRNESGAAKRAGAKRATKKPLAEKVGGASLSLHFDLKIKAQVQAISPLVDRIMRMVSDLEYAKGKEFEIEMALREALANAVVHGAKADASKKVECCVRGEKDSGIHIIVRDPGPGFDPSRVSSPTDEQNLFSDHGRGIYLINKLMDEVRYERNGAEIHMRKY